VRQLRTCGLLDDHLEPANAMSLLGVGRWSATATLAAQLMHNGE
jgi:hypothetical protein